MAALESGIEIRFLFCCCMWLAAAYMYASTPR
eukprot:SAG31_NODE_32179_length_359_cov_0.600000_1_plen_31_part_10